MVRLLIRGRCLVRQTPRESGPRAYIQVIKNHEKTEGGAKKSFSLPAFLIHRFGTYNYEPWLYRIIEPFSKDELVDA
jgi:hypothetical protein